MLDVEKDRPDAVLLQARALAETGSTPRENAKQQQAAIARLEAAVKSTPRFVEAYHTLCEIHLKRNDRDAAVAVLKQDLKANPSDATAAARLGRAARPGADGAASRPSAATSTKRNESPARSPPATTPAR